jgi:alkanesulfonate monooxygenase SsuD/methylene tetrahydromethanopterin reductase-like flavin-dependent oxidoreductase (luciferase family)
VARLHFGLAIDFGSDTEPLDRRIDRLLPLLAEAERLGFESVSAGESYPTRGGFFHLPSPLLVLAALAPQTGLRLGTGVILLPAWNPLRLAYDTAVLDQLSNGRVFLGAGAGNPGTWQRFGAAADRLATRLDETLQALKALWRGEDGFTGDTVQVLGGIRPLPVQPGGPPIWLGGLVPRAATRAARFADGWFAASNHRLDTVIEPQARRYRDALDGGGPPLVAANRFTVVADSDAEARRVGGPAIEATLQLYAAMGGLADADGNRLPAGAERLGPQLDEALLLLGQPDTVNRRLERYAAAGVTHLQLRIGPADLAHDTMLRSVRLLGEQVLPAWR